jgi:Ycf66 protein N-terminus
MVNFGLNSASILGIFLAVAGASLYFMRTVRPELSRDHDIFFAAVGLLCGFILLFQGWRLDPILQFGQFLLTGSAIFFAVESIRLRSVATEQARRNTPTVDRDRPVSKTRVYREAEYDRDYDRIEPHEDEEPNYDNPRLRGYSEPKTSRRKSYDSEEPRPSKTKSRTNDRPDPRTNSSNNDRNSSRTPRETSRTTSRRSMNPADLGSAYEDWDEDASTWNDEEESYTQERPSRNRPSETATKPSKNRRQRPSEFDRAERGSLGDRDAEDIPPADYVDYQPIDDGEDESPLDREDY